MAIGIEVAEPATIEYGISEGRLPNLAKLREDGCIGPLQSDCNLSSGCIWPSFQTGRGPGGHGFHYYHMQLVHGTYGIDKLSPAQMAGVPFWKRASEAGRRCAIVDVPITRPIAMENGVQVVGWGVEAAAHPPASSPPSLLDELRARVGEHPLKETDRRRFIRPTTAEGVASTAGRILASVDAKGALLEEVARRGPWDLFVGVFAETHWATHVLYHVFDPHHPEYRPELQDGAPDFRLRLLEAHDRAIGKLLRAMPDANTVVFSGSGPAPAFGGNHLLPEVLTRLGYGGGDRSLGAFQSGMHRIRALNDWLPAPLLRALKAWTPERLWVRWSRRAAFAGSGWSKSRAFALVNDWAGMIRINLRGREPSGTVAPEEYDAVCRELTDALLELTLADSGRPAVREVVKVRDTYPGERVDHLPDLSIRWERDEPITSLHSPRLGRISGRTPEKRPGAHSPQGLILLSGPDFETGSRLQEPHLVDLAPTLLAVLGVPLPDDLCGRVLEEALAPGRTDAGC